MDLTQTKETSSFQPIPKGRYRAVIDGAEAKLSKSSSQPMIRLVGRVTEGPYADRLFWDYLLVTNGEKSSFAKKKLRALGVNVDVVQDDNDVCDQLVGRECFVELKVVPSKDKDTKEPRTEIDAATGQTINIMQNNVVGYDTRSLGAFVAQQPAVRAPAPNVGQGQGYTQAQFAAAPPQTQQLLAAYGHAPQVPVQQFQGVATGTAPVQGQVHTGQYPTSASQPIGLATGGVAYVGAPPAGYAPAPQLPVNGNGAQQYAQPAWAVVAAQQNQNAAQELGLDGQAARVRTRR